MGAASEESRQRLAETIRRMKQVKNDPAAHLRRNPIQMGFATTVHSTSRATSNLTSAMANDAKWSTDLKKLEISAAKRALYERRLTAATSGSMLPELPTMPKNYITQLEHYEDHRHESLM